MKVSTRTVALLAALAMAVLPGIAGAAITEVVNEDFDGLLGSLQTSDAGDPNSEVSAGRGAAIDGVVGWTHTPPAGWTVDNSAMLTDNGISEWEGWSFVTPTFWETADGQERSNFLLAGSNNTSWDDDKTTTVIAVADPDEYDDANSGAAANGFRSSLLTPSFSISGRTGVVINFVSHYRPEDFQRAEVRIDYLDASDAIVSDNVVVFNYPAATTKDDGSTQNKAIQIAIESADFAGGATKARVKWYLIGDNDWFWAIDEVQIRVHDGELVDTDSDGIFDDDEATYGTSPTDDDSDDDGLKDGQEVFDYDTVPTDDDTDDDLVIDGDEVLIHGSDPKDSDTDGDGIDDGTEVNTDHTLPTETDSDGDGVDDPTEKSDGTDATNPYEYSGAASRGTLFFDSFEGYTEIADAVTAGWAASGTDAPWAIDVVALSDPAEQGNQTKANPPTLDGSPSKGMFVISKGVTVEPDADSSTNNLTTPTIDCSSASLVWLHADVSVTFDEDGKAAFVVAVSNNGGSTWTEKLVRVNVNRAGTVTYQPSTANADGYFGRLELNISDVAANQANVQIRFRHIGAGTDDFWAAIDNVQVDQTAAETGGPITIFSEDFNDNTLGSMIAESLITPANTGTETWSTTIKDTNKYQPNILRSQAINRLMHPAVLGAGDTATFAFLDSDGNPDPEEDEYLKTPALDLSSYSKVYLHWTSESLINFSDNGPVMDVLYSVDGGWTWQSTPVFSYRDTDPETFDGLAADGSDTNPYYAERVIEVPGAAGALSAAFAFRFKSGGDEWWWAVDDVMVTGVQDTTDTDSDGLYDQVEDVLGSDKNLVDTDGDGLEDGEEVNTYLTSPIDVDSDGDGVNDDIEVNTDSTDPTDVYDYSGATAPGTVYFSETFDSVLADRQLETLGWTISDTATAEEDATWTINNPGGRNNPGTRIGRASGGNFMVSDSDAASGGNPTGTGASHDLITPEIDLTSAIGSVWMHASVLAQANNDDGEVFIVDVTSNDGATWNRLFTRVGDGRDVPPLPSNNNVGAYLGQLDLNLTPYSGMLVKLRFRHFEPTDDWYFSVDDIQVDDVTPVVGYPLGAVAFSHSFDGGGLAPMTVTSNADNTGNQSWNTADTGGRYSPGNLQSRGVNRLEHPAPRNGDTTVNFAIIDPDAAEGLGATDMDEWLITPVVDLTGLEDVHLHYSDEAILEFGPVQVLISLDGGSTWSTVFQYTDGANDDEPGVQDAGWNDEEGAFYQERVLAVPQADGENNVKFAWYYGGHASDDHYWAIDNIMVTAWDPAAADGDGDGLTNAEEATLGTDERIADSDFDGLNDGDEVNTYNTNPLVLDSDGDGLNDGVEANVYGTDPANDDTDGDGVSDSFELEFGSDPLNAADFPELPVAGLAGLALAALGLLAGGAVAARNRK